MEDEREAAWAVYMTRTCFTVYWLLLAPPEIFKTREKCKHCLRRIMLVIKPLWGEVVNSLSLLTLSRLKLYIFSFSMQGYVDFA